MRSAHPPPPATAGRAAPRSKVLHNVWYCFLGAVQWTVFEALYTYCVATGRMPHVDDAAAFAALKNGTLTRDMVNFVACFFWVPLCVPRRATPREAGARDRQLATWTVGV